MANKKSTLRRNRASNFWGTIKRLISYMSNRAWWILVVFILSAGAAILSAQLPLVMGNITTTIFEGLGVETGVDFQVVGRLIVTLGSFYVFSAVFRYLQQFITARISQHTVYELRKDIKEKMGRLPISYFDTHSNGDILSRAINDMDQISNALGQSLTQILTSVFQFLAILITMLSLSGPLAILIILMIPLNIFIIRFLAPRAQEQFGIRQNEIGKLNDYVEEVYSGHAIVKVFNQEENEEEIFAEKSEKVNEAAWKAEYYAGLMNPRVGAAKDFIFILITIFGGYGVVTGSIAIGVVQAFLQYANQFSQPFRALANLANTIQITIAAAERVFEVLDEEEMDEPAAAEPKENSPYKIEFEHVQFGYNDQDLLMTDFNLQVNEGEMIAIVGPTGAGKTTLINLLERFYDVKGGAIRYEGSDVRDMTREELREKFSMVLQDTWLFSGTIWDNLTYGTKNKTKEEVLKASKAAHVHDFVETLPDGYNTILEEDGVNISQGQRQLITIARAFLQDPEILILDEATSSVDTRTEILIQQAMEKLLENRTSFVVAHRLSTIRDADRIIVMNQGDVIETGSHDELMDQEGFYANLYNAQFA
ncbi:MAG TPA: ABC transporter ATP-binding protein [Atopostipes sp.]|nr:ABC transporter ATP-binding protein [Atopostipes sp.]